MKKNARGYSLLQRLGAMCLALLMVAGMLPATSVAAVEATDVITTVSDPETLTRPETIYGDSTVNTGKVTVGKSVSDTDITVNGQNISIDGENNFLVTVSQSAQATGLVSETNVPLDVVIVFDTSGSMGNDSNGNGKNRTQELVEAANKMIGSLMEMNEQNRVGVVAFSAHNAGGGTAGYNAANVLSELDHYTGEAATEHLTWATGAGPSWAGTVQLVRGRSTTNGVRNSRYGTGGATNIQAGVTLGAQMLTEADTTVQVNGQTVTRTPILILMSDGCPTVSAYENQWWNASQTNNQGPQSAPFMGNGFLTVLTASYYKNAITEHYYGANATQKASIYTVGVELANAATQDTDEEVALSYMTLNPKGEFVSGSDNYYYDRSTAEDSFLDAWNSYQKNEEFKVRVWSGQSRHDGFYYFYNSTKTLQNANDYKNGPDVWTTVGRTTVNANILSAVKTLQYNDAFYDVADVSDLTDALDNLLMEIARKAVTVPTRVTSGDHNFDGYVTFTDPIGEYMEVKDVKGILANGNFYKGATFAQKMSQYGTAAADPAFDDLMHTVLKTRMSLSAADGYHNSEAELDAFIDNLLLSAKNSANQANYTNANNFDNSIVWWGNAYDSGEEDEHVQMIGFADNDTIEYIEEQDAAGTIPAGADYVCRSYFYFGTAGNTIQNPNNEFLYFMVRVQRELEFPYRETVVISAPASLLSVEKVLISESYDDDGNPVYTATVEHQEPARVVYEVGLWDNINAENVASIVDAEYTDEALTGTGSVNYDPATGTYSFFTNDWDRTETQASHHRSMTKATFDAAADNPFYTYQADTLLVNASGNAVTSNPAGGTAYYVREYYEWTDNGRDGTYNATKKSTLIKVDIPAGTNLLQKDGKWYIPAGAYTAATLVVNGDDAMKDDLATPAVNDGNFTGTSSVVAHPHRTGNADNSHYTVFLGNNGKLTLVADTYEPVKTVSVNLPASATAIVDDEGNPVKVGDVLTYTVEVKNIMNAAADITVTDYVPAGTAFVAGSAGSGTTPTGHTKDASIVPNSNNVLTWVLEDVPAGETRYVSFQAKVTNAALSLTVVPGAIENTANVQIGNAPTVQTNTTHNPPYGKTVTDTNNQNIDGQHGLKVGGTVVYHIRFQNNATNSDGEFVAADATVTDKIPEGTTFVSADNGGTYNAANGTVSWTFDNMAAGSAKVVSFQVQVNANAKAQGAVNGIEPASGEIYLPNTATIVIDHDPDITLITNTTENWADLGNLVISKQVADGGDQTKTFTINLTESTGLLSGKYPVTGGDANFVEFAEGKGSVTIKHGQTLTIKGLPAGAIITVAEDVSALPGWTPTYNTQSVTITKGETAVASVDVVNTYNLQPLTLTLKGVKTLKGVNLTQDTTFGFIAMPDRSNPVAGDPLTGEVTVKNTGDYSFTMSSKTFTQPGTYRYTISEINGGAAGITYDDTVYMLVINVTDNGDGTMSATAKLDGNAFNLENDAVAFENTYVPEETQLVLTADKAMTGRKLTAGEFHFQLTDGTNTYKGINDADGNIIFESITFDAIGKHTYTLSEVVPDPKADGVTYDTKTYTVVVTISDAGGQLTTSVTVDGKAVAVENGVADTGVIFQNSFEPDDVPLTLTAKKSFKVYDASTGEYVDAAPEAGKFRFQIVDKADADKNAIATGTNDAGGNVVFDPIYFSADMFDGYGTKTFTYEISEVVSELAKDPNMRYDESVHTIEVSVEYTTEGKLKITVNGNVVDGTVDLTDSVVFTNYSNPTSVSVAPAGKKTTNGENLPDGLSFSFKVVPVNGSTDAATGTSNPTAGGTSSETKDITFTSMIYTSENLGNEATKSYDYWIMESNASAGNVTGSNGVTYDTTRYLYRVTLSRDDYNRLIATEQYFALKDGGTAGNVGDYTEEVAEANVSFVNTYNAAAHINLTATKILDGRTPGLKANEFDFLLQRLTSKGQLVEGSHVTGTNDANGTIHFATLNYSSQMLDDAYKGDDGAYYFSYLMSEIKPQDVAVPGVTYDIAKYVVTIKLTQTANGLTAELEDVSTAKLNEDGSYAPYNPVAGFNANGTTNAPFTNTYSAVEGDEVKYRIGKEMSGRDAREGEFEFSLYQVDAEGNLHLEYVASNDAEGYAVFSRTIPASAASRAGTYQMVIKEDKGSLAGVNYSQQEFTFFIKIADNSEGKVNATIHLTKEGPALPEDANGMVDLTALTENPFIFKNTYVPNGTSYTPTADKTLTGRNMVAGEFSFQAQLINAKGVAVTDGKIYSGVNTADGKVVFEAIPYADGDEGIYIYEISEVKGTHKGMSYDDAVYYLKVVVTDEGNGELKTAATYHKDAECTALGSVNAITFHNTYVPADVPVQLEATKTLAGRELEDKEFYFVVRENDANGEIVATGSNDANGKILFSTFSITAEDMNSAVTKASKEFTYVIMESDNNVPGVTVDSKMVNVTVTVTDDGEGALKASVQYPNNQPVVFANTYAPGSVNVPLVAFKTLQGKNLTADEFTFELKEGSTVLQHAKNTADGTVSFQNLVFDAEDLKDADGNYVMEKTFYYTVSEKAGTVEGMVYDDTVYNITVKVTDDGKGKLTADVTYTKGNESAELIQFANNYTPQSIQVELEGTKTIVDPNGNTLNDSKYPLNGFEFEVYDTEGNLVTTAQSDAEGKIVFTGFEFTAAGEYRFLISEKTTDRPGYTTDPTVWCVHITIGYNAATGLLTKDNVYVHLAPENHEEGLMAQVSEDLTFTNVYDPADVEVTVKGNKTLTGRELKDHEFTFYMVDKATGLRVAETRNHSNGDIIFNLKYDKAGTYHYTVSELIPTENEKLGGVHYTTKTYDVTVTVTDDGTGKLVATVGKTQITGSGIADLTGTVKFENRYQPDSAAVNIEAVKHLTGKALAGKDFTFQLVNNADGSEKYTATNDANGKIVFETITFAKAGVYEYTLSEIPGNAGGMQYDQRTYTVTVTVTDNGFGKLSASASYANSNGGMASTLVFSNSYQPTETQLELTATKKLSGRDLTAGEFHFQLTDGTNVYKGVNDASGNIIFETITYTTTGTYTYTLSEVVPDSKAEGITYDEKSYPVVVEVTDRNGQLVAKVTVDGKVKNVVNDTVNTGVTFHNRFNPNDIPLTLTAKKSFKVYNTATGKYVDAAPEAGKFRFQIVDKADADKNAVATGTNDANGNIQFSTIYFSEELLEGVTAVNGVKTKKFTYVISEVVSDLAKDPNMYYDLSEKEIEVTLTYTNTGVLTVSVNGDTDGTVDLTNSVVFTNYSNPDSVSVTPAGKKTTEGHNLPEGLSFSFKVVPVGGDTDAATGTSNATVGGKDSETNAITFTSMVYTSQNLGNDETKTYSYWIMESNASAGNVTGSNGVTYDNTRYLYQVTLKRDAYNRLIATEKYFKLKNGGKIDNAADYTVAVTEANVSFNNLYNAKAHINLTATKELTGRTPGLAANEFDFVLQRLTSDGKVIPESQITGTNYANGTIHFATLNYSNAMLDEAYQHSDGAYYFSYLMSEIMPEGVAIPGVTYDDTKYVVTIKVKQSSADGMSAELANVSKAQYDKVNDTYAPGSEVAAINPNGSTGVTFKNVYHPVEGDQIKYQIRKNLEGRDLREGEFEFSLYQVGEDGKLHLEYVATNDADGYVTFSRMIPASAASRAGTYKMVIKEDKGSLAGVTYSEEEFTFFIKIADNGKGKVEASIHLTENGPALPKDSTGMVDLTEEIVFNNTYYAKETNYEPVITKELTGRDMIAGEFSFQVKLIGKNGVAVDNGAVYTGVNTANGEVIVESIPYVHGDEGTYVYEISEILGDHRGVAYDATVYYLKVVVTDEGHGHMKADASYYTDEACTKDASAVTFYNSYKAGATSLSLEAWKYLDGKTLKADDFTFELVGAGDKYTATNDAAGRVVFDTIVYETAGEYTYTLREVNEGADGVTYDDVTYTVTVKVVDDGSGKLAATASFKNDETGSNAMRATFHNTYKAKPVSYQPEAKKFYEGETTMPTFHFVLSGEGFATQTKQNNDKGEIVFDELTFDKAGEYAFTVYEQPDDDVTDIRWDDTKYTLTIKVVDEGDGQLKIDEASSNIDTALVFRNFHEGTLTKKDVFLNGDLSISIDGQKVETGDVLTYTVSYTNPADEAIKVTITDKIPAHTIYVDGSADNGGAYMDGVLVWNNIQVAPKETVTVKFDVVIAEAKVVVENQAEVMEGKNTFHTNVIQNPVEENQVTKDVFHAAEPTVSIDGENVKAGDILLYKVTYTNSDDFAADVTITDKISQYTTYVEGSADNDGVYADGILTWNLQLAAGESKTVSFQVKVVGTNVTVTNQAIALEGKNEMKTNVVSNPVPVDEVEKDVFYADEPTVSIDGEAVKAGDTLLYKVTYTNSFEAAADVTITDKISQYTTYVDGSADNGGVYADGVLTWKLHLEPSESKTVTFQVKVVETNITVANQATALEGKNELKTDVVENPVPEDEVQKDVFLADKPTVSIDGETVKVGDILLYKVTYTNSFEAAADVTISDKIPVHTTYVDGSADNGGVYADGVLTWKLHLEAGESKAVTFQVKVTEGKSTVANQATALEGENALQTNEVKNPVKDVPVTPDTGDRNHLVPYLILMTVSGTCLIGFVVLMMDKRRKMRAR